MYFKDFKKIKIGGISGSFLSADLDNDNCIVKSVEKDRKNNLIIRLIKKGSNIEGTVHIKSETDDGKSILEKILIGNKILGKTLNELRGSKLEDLY